MSKTIVETVQVSLAQRSYQIHIGSGLLARAPEFLMPLGLGGKIAIVADETAATLHLERFVHSLCAAGMHVETIRIPGGESTKSWVRLEQVVENLLTLKIERNDTVVAFGGGVVGDLAGFAAAILRRGIRCIQVPTTLLAQVDSSVGGKTGINSPQGKNLIGAFWQPSLVLADIDVLQTLDTRTYLSGYAEIVKCGLLANAEFFDWLEAHASQSAARDPKAQMHAIKTACAMKAEIVARDECETGVRALLNLGHTFAHALEAATGYCDRLFHGEAVSIGLTLAFEASARMGLCPCEDARRVHKHLLGMGMKTSLADISGELPDAGHLFALMGQDKKVREGVLTFVLARAIGETFTTQDIDLNVIKSLLHR